MTRIDLCYIKLDGSCENNTGFSLYLNEDVKEIFYLYSKCGVICFVSENRFYASNPSKREIFSLPDAAHCAKCAKGEVIIGIGYVKESNEYVLVHLFHKRKYGKVSCEVLRLRENGIKDCEWKAIEAKCSHLVRGCGVLVENVFYWMTDCRCDHTGDVIVSFNHVKEKFGTVSAPMFYFPRAHGAGRGWSLVDLGGSLCMVDETCHDKIDIWVRKDWFNHEWIMEYRIDMREFGASSRIFTPIDCWNGKLWIQMDTNIRGFVYYDTDKRCIMKMENPIPVNWWSWLRLYTESLFSIGGI